MERNKIESVINHEEGLFHVCFENGDYVFINRKAKTWMYDSTFDDDDDDSYLRGDYLIIDGKIKAGCVESLSYPDEVEDAIDEVEFEHEFA